MAEDRPSEGLAQFLRDESRHEAAVKLEAELKLNLTDEQKDMLVRFVGDTGRLPTAIEFNIEDQVAGEIERSTLFPVTVLVGAMA